MLNTSSDQVRSQKHRTVESLLSDDNLVLSKLKFGSLKVFWDDGSVATCDVTEENFNFPGGKKSNSCIFQGNSEKSE